MYLKEFRHLVHDALEDWSITHGFRRRRSQRFARIVGEMRVDVIEIQKLSGSPKCCVNLGTDYVFLPNFGSSDPPHSPLDLRQSECLFGTRIKLPEQSDTWWEMTDENAAKVADAISEYALAFFERYQLDAEIDRITPDDCVDGPPTLLTDHFAPERCLLFLAQVREHAGRTAEAIAFAKLGIEAANKRRYGTSIYYLQRLLARLQKG